MIALASAIDFARRNWLSIAFAALALFAAYQTLTKRAAVAERDGLKREAVVWARTSKTQEQSIMDLMASLDRKNAESDARAAELTAARQREAQAAAQMDARAATARSQIETLNRLAKSGNSVCGVTDELREALEGL